MERYQPDDWKLVTESPAELHLRWDRVTFVLHQFPSSPGVWWLDIHFKNNVGGALPDLHNCKLGSTDLSAAKMEALQEYGRRLEKFLSTTTRRVDTWSAKSTNGV